MKKERGQNKTDTISYKILNKLYINRKEGYQIGY